MTSRPTASSGGPFPEGESREDYFCKACGGALVLASYDPCLCEPDEECEDVVQEQFGFVAWVGEAPKSE